MKITKTKIEGLLIFEPQIFEDDRGSFFESWNENVFKKYLKDIKFVQDNQSISKKNCLRGLHFQDPPYAQGKLVRVIKGSVLDVAVDLRKKSKTYGQHEKVILSATNNKIFWIPEGFAHGFISLEEDTIFSYKCTNFYNKELERTILWNDSKLNIDWSIKSKPFISEKDLIGESFDNFQSKFV